MTELWRGEVQAAAPHMNIVASWAYAKPKPFKASRKPYP